MLLLLAAQDAPALSASAMNFYVGERANFLELENYYRETPVWPNARRFVVWVTLPSKADAYCESDDKLGFLWMLLRRCRAENQHLHPQWHVRVRCESPLVFALEIEGLKKNEMVYFGGCLDGMDMDSN